MPLNRLLLPCPLTRGTTAPTVLGSAIDAVMMTASQDGGLWSMPFRTPLDMDRSRPATLRICLFMPSGAPIAAAEVTLRIVRTIVEDGGGQTSLTTNNPFTVPNFWPVQQPLFVNPEVVGSELFPAGILTPNSLIGLTIERRGSAPLDNWPNTLGLVRLAWFEYSQDCRWCLC